MPVNYYKTYTDAANAAQQQQRLAELLQQQAQEPIPQYAYQGIQAMPSYAAGLAKILSAYGAKRASDKAAEASRQAQERVDQAGTGIAGRLMGGFTPDASLVKKTDMGYEAAPQQVPEQTSLEEVTRTSQYKQSPEDALRMAMTPAGGAAMQRNPLLAQMLSQYAGPKTPEEFYQPTETAGGELVQFGKRGGRKETGFQAAPKPDATTTVGRLMKERDALPPNDPRRAIYDSAIASETAPKGTTVNVDTKGTQVGQELFLKKVDEQNTSAIKSKKILDRLGNLDAATAAGTYTGSTAPGAMAASQFLNGLGINFDPKTLANSRTFQAAANQLVLDFMSANGGARGFTEKESAILYDAFPKIVDSPQARKQITDLLRQRAKDDIESYNSSLASFQKAFPNVRTAYEPIGAETQEDRYQRWLRSQQGKPK